MVWGAITIDGPGPLIRLQGKIGSVHYRAMLENDVLPWFRQKFGDGGVLQQDNASIHTAHSVMTFLAQQGVTLLEWPPQSPDLSPIENLWSIVKQRLRDRKPPNLNALWDLVQEEWRKVTPDLCRRLYASMPRRVEMTIKQKGFPTKY